MSRHPLLGRGPLDTRFSLGLRHFRRHHSFSYLNAAGFEHLVLKILLVRLESLPTRLFPLRLPLLLPMSPTWVRLKRLDNAGP